MKDYDKRTAIALDKARRHVVDALVGKTRLRPAVPAGLLRRLERAVRRDERRRAAKRIIAEVNDYNEDAEEGQTLLRAARIVRGR